MIFQNLIECWFIFYKILILTEMDIMNYDFVHKAELCIILTDALSKE